MPPRPKFKREEIISAALDIVSQNGMEALTAKSLCQALGSSASPIFTVFDSMQDIQREVRTAAMARFDAFAATAQPDLPLFKQVGMNMVRFGVQEPKLYQLLFMQETRSAATFDEIFGTLGSTAALCIQSLQRDYALTPAAARTLFENVWIYTFGIGALCATGACRFSEQQLSELLSREFRAMMLLVQSEAGGDTGSSTKAAAV